MHPRSLQNPDVQVPLPAPQVQVRLTLRATLHRHRLSSPRNQDGDIYEDMECHKRYYDTSDYPKDHPHRSQENKKVIGKMKDECNGKPISEVVCLRSKMYSILIEGGENKKKAKGTEKVVTKKEINHQNYKDALFNRQTFKHGMDMLRSEDHQILMVHLNKTTLSPSDSKRWIKEDGIHTLAYGHKDVEFQTPN